MLNMSCTFKHIVTKHVLEWTFFLTSKFKSEMPSSPTSYAVVVNNLIVNATPRKAKALDKSLGHVKRKLYDRDIFNGMAKSMKSLKNLKGPVKSSSMTTFGKICLNSGMSHKKVVQLGLSSRAFSNIKKGRSRKKRKDAMQPEVVNQVQDFWYEKSRELPLQKRVEKKQAAVPAGKHLLNSLQGVPQEASPGQNWVCQIRSAQTSQRETIGGYGAHRLLLHCV